MQIKSWMEWAWQAGQSGARGASQLITGSYGFVQDVVGRLPLLGSAETSDHFDSQCDEKHYLVIPFRQSEAGHSLYVLRCLPEGVPPINDLPKRRVFHLPHPNGGPLLRQLLLEDAREKASETTDEGVGDSLNALADRIDQIEGKVFYGLLAIGGLVALANPLVGATIAAKSLIPSLGLELSRFGLKSAGEALQKRRVEGQVRAAEKEVRRQFSETKANSFVNPLLEQLEWALRTGGEEYRPLEDWTWQSDDESAATLAATDRERWGRLTKQAVVNVYRDVMQQPKQWAAASLGAEDVAWLRAMQAELDQEQGPSA